MLEDLIFWSAEESEQCLHRYVALKVPQRTLDTKVWEMKRQSWKSISLLRNLHTSLRTSKTSLSWVMSTFGDSSHTDCFAVPFSLWTCVISIFHPEYSLIRLLKRKLKMKHEVNQWYLLQIWSPVEHVSEQVTYWQSIDRVICTIQLTPRSFRHTMLWLKDKAPTKNSSARQHHSSTSNHALDAKCVHHYIASLYSAISFTEMARNA